MAENEKVKSCLRSCCRRWDQLGLPNHTSQIDRICITKRINNPQICTVGVLVILVKKKNNGILSKWLIVFHLYFFFFKFKFGVIVKFMTHSLDLSIQSPVIIDTGLGSIPFRARVKLILLFHHWQFSQERTWCSWIETWLHLFSLK